MAQTKSTSTAKKTSGSTKPQTNATKQQSTTATSSKQSSATATGAKIACTVTNCTHFSNNCCDAKSIKVQGAPQAGSGPVAVDTKADTCCTTFKCK